MLVTNIPSAMLVTNIPFQLLKTLAQANVMPIADRLSLRYSGR
ncbi:hypothetical protein [Sodalis sp.]